MASLSVPIPFTSRHAARAFAVAMLVWCAPLAPALAQASLPLIEAPAGGGLAFAAGGHADPALALPAPAPPLVVIELFTSQGCASCPPADALLADSADAGAVLPLSFHVDYWDYLGWRDALAQPAFTARQHAYAREWGERSVYTPQLVVGGTDTLVTLRPADLMALIAAHRQTPARVRLDLEAETGGARTVTVHALSDLGGPAQVILARYRPRQVVDIARGENRGRQIEYRNIVTDWQVIADWDGAAPLRLTLPARQGPAALLVQAQGRRGAPASGPMLAAARLD